MFNISSTEAVDNSVDNFVFLILIPDCSAAHIKLVKFCPRINAIFYNELAITIF